jgi:ADP-ribosylglycohydrolase
MNAKRLPLFLALAFLVTSFAHAGRDESLIQLTRKNQLAYDAKMKKEKQEKEKQEKEKQEKETEVTATAVPHSVQAADNGASSEPSTPASP